MQTFKLVFFQGDGISNEVEAAVLPLLKEIQKQLQNTIKIQLARPAIGGLAYEQYGHPLPEQVLDACTKADAALLVAVGNPKYDSIARELRPEQAILGLRKALGLFSNFRPIQLQPELLHASTLKPEVIQGLDMLIVRELSGDVYFGQPRGIRKAVDGFVGAEEGFDTMRYSVPEVERIAHTAFKAAQMRHKKVCSVDKANVLETSQLWRQTVNKVALNYPDVELSHMYVDNAAMQLIKNPKFFDVLLTGNLFGDILSDQAAMLVGSIGMLPSASFNEQGYGLYEPCHGSAPDIAGQNKVNPLATILCIAMMVRYSLKQDDLAKKIELAVKRILKQHRTADIHVPGTKLVNTDTMAKLVTAELAQLAMVNFL